MAVVVDKYNEKTYSLVINSQDKISGTNNNATYQINWDDFLPRDISNYKVIFSFQTSGGYYSDGLLLIPTTTSGTLPTNTGVATINNAKVAAGYPVGTSTMALNGVVGTITAGGGQYVIGGGCSGITLSKFYGTVDTTATSVIVNQPTVSASTNGDSVYFYNTTLANAVNYSSARVVLSTSSTSYSFDTSTKSPTLNLGAAQRDIQTAQSKSNTLSTFYCQNPPRCMARPSNNSLTVQIYNNYVFAGGITGYSGTTPTTYSRTAVNNNFLTDTNQYGTAIATSNDMTSYTLYLEFIPLK